MELEQSLRQSILSTLAYFDLSQFPLTKEELFVFLWEPPTVNYADFLELLQTDSFVNGNFETKNGYYFLPGQEKNIESKR